MKKLIIVFILIQTCFFMHSQEAIIKSGETWEYFDEGYLDDDWTNNINKYKWKSGATPLGYGDNKVLTEISFGADEQNKEFIEYFKKEVVINKNDFFGYEFKLLRDDGAIVYVNGKVLYRSNMENWKINKKILPIETISGKEEEIYHSNVFDADIFKDGKNTIAVAVYQSYASSSDLFFDLELIGYKSGTVLSELVSKKENVNRDLQLKLTELNYKFDLEQTESKNNLLQNSNYTLKVLLFIISILFIICLFSIYYLIENQKKKIQKLNSDILVKGKECLEKDKEMLYLSTKLLNNKQLIKELKVDIKGIATNDKSTIKSITQEIENILQNNEEWDILKNHFSAVYSGFYDKLIKLHPELSDSDLKHCMFIKLHMQTKEIARILLIDPRSVQTTRYRIKKKIKLDEDTDLREYLLSI